MRPYVRQYTRQEKFAESLGTLITLVILWGGIYAVLWALAETAEAQECVEDAMNRPGRDGAYPTGCFVKPVPAEPSNCVSWDNIGPDKKCTNYREEPETQEPEAQEPEVSCGVEGKPACDARDSYQEIWPSKPEDQLERTPDGPCRRKNWSYYFQTCSEFLTPEELNALIFHPEGGTYQQHHAAAEENICRMEALLSYVAFIYFDTVVGPYHSFTQQNKLSYVVKQRECENRFGVK